MFVKLAALFCTLAAANAVYNGPLAGGKPADLYPAGVSPQACPNFPNCANPAVAANPNAPAHQWGAQPAWNQGANQWNQGNQWNPAPVPQSGNQWNPSQQNALDRGEYTGDGDWHGEGLAEALAPGYANQGQWNSGNQWDNHNNGQWNGGNQWNNGANQWNQAAHAPTGIPAQIPAGVDAHSCPNYPFCH